MSAMNSGPASVDQVCERYGVLWRVFGYLGEYSGRIILDKGKVGKSTETGGQGKSAASARCSWDFSCHFNQQLALPAAASFAARAAGACMGFTHQYRGLRASFPIANGSGA